MRVRAGDGRGRRQFEPVGAAGWAGEECVEWEFAAVERGRGVSVSGSREGWRRELRLADGAIGWWYGVEMMDGLLIGC